MIVSAVLQDDLIVEDYPVLEEKILTGDFDLELIVIDADSGRPIPGALIGIDGANRTGTCSDSGRAVISKLNVGNYEVDVIKCGYAAAVLVFEAYSLGSHTHVVRMTRNS